LGSNKEPLDEDEIRLVIKAHKKLGTGISDFTHIKVPDSGHLIQNDQPEAVLSAILDVLNKVQ